MALSIAAMGSAPSQAQAKCKAPKISPALRAAVHSAHMQCRSKTVIARAATTPVRTEGARRGSVVQLERALEALRAGRPVAILDDAGREGETDLHFAAQLATPASIRALRVHAGGELYVAVSNAVATAFGIPFAGQALRAAAHEHPTLAALGKETSSMCQGDCSVSLSFDHRSTKTGAPDVERSFTVRRFAELSEDVTSRTVSVPQAGRALGAEFHSPGHIFWCIEHPGGLRARRGHTELAVALARAAGVVPVTVGCVMLHAEGDDFGPVGPDAARAWAERNDVPFLTGPEIADALGAQWGAADKA